jgi:hypothetical protein
LLCVFARNKKALQQTRQALLMARGSMLIATALGIGAASFWSAAEKDIAESPTAELEAEPERPKKEDYKSTRLHDYKLLG